MEHDQARQVLGLAENFTVAQLDQAFRARALEHHPDRGGDPAAMKRLVEARTILTQSTTTRVGPRSADGSPPPPDAPMDRISFTAVSLVLLIPVAILAALVIITIVVVASNS